MTATPTDPLAGVERLLVDGNNLLHAIRRGPEPAPAATLIGRLRGAIPAQIRVEIVFDGPPDPGSGNVRVASGVTVRYSGRISADSLLIRLVDEAGGGSLEHARPLLVVTDDGALGAAIRRLGGRTTRTAWLMARLGRTRNVAPSIGAARPPLPPQSSGDDDGPGWRPGRGATAKRGNAKRLPKQARTSERGR